MIDLEDIKKITDDINSYIKYRFVRIANWQELFEKLMCEIAFSMSEWSGNTYVGDEKDKKLENVYQAFFESLYMLIDFLHERKDKIMIEEQNFINSIRYSGKIYRYLGYGNCQDKRINSYIKPNFSSIFVSWSKNRESSYLESKLYGRKTRLYCEIPHKHYGLDYECFQEFLHHQYECDYYISRGEEREVVFPTIEEYVYKIEYM